MLLRLSITVTEKKKDALRFRQRFEKDVETQIREISKKKRENACVP